MANNQLQFTHLPIHSFTHELFDNFYKIMQNKPNLPKAQINITIVLTKDYGNARFRGGLKKQTQSNPISVKTPKNPKNKRLKNPTETVILCAGWTQWPRSRLNEEYYLPVKLGDKRCMVAGFRGQAGLFIYAAGGAFFS